MNQAQRQAEIEAQIRAGANLKSLRGGTVIHANSRYAASQGNTHPACGARATNRGLASLRMAWGLTTAPVTCQRCIKKYNDNTTEGN